MKELDKKEIKSKSLMANIVDTEEDFHPPGSSHLVHPSQPLTNICMTRWGLSQPDQPHNSSNIQIQSQYKQSGVWEPDLSAAERVRSHSEGNQDHYWLNKRRWWSLCSCWRLEVCSDGSRSHVPYLLHNIHNSGHLRRAVRGPSRYRQVISSSFQISSLPAGTLM